MTTTAHKPCIEALPPTRTHKHRGIRWQPHGPADRCPCSGDLTITQGKKSETYRVTQFGCDWPGLAVRLDKADGSDHYSVFISNDGKAHSCDCPGASYLAKAKADRRHGAAVDPDTTCCKHVDAVLGLVANGWLADPQAGPAGGDWSPVATPEELDATAPADPVTDAAAELKLLAGLLRLADDIAADIQSRHGVACPCRTCRVDGPVFLDNVRKAGSGYLADLASMIEFDAGGGLGLNGDWHGDDLAEIAAYCRVLENR